MAGLTIGKFAAAQGVGVETVRFYQRRGLLALPERRGSGFREYSEDDQWRLAFIRRARRLVRVCEHGNSDDCVALQLGEPA
jgi:DNA-binding transcriptional MerR regulator